MRATRVGAPVWNLWILTVSLQRDDYASSFLSPRDLSFITGKIRPSAQKRVLRSYGVDFLVRPDGSLVVHRDAIEQRLGISPETTSPKSKPKLNLDIIL